MRIPLTASLNLYKKNHLLVGQKSELISIQRSKGIFSACMWSFVWIKQCLPGVRGLGVSPVVVDLLGGNPIGKGHVQQGILYPSCENEREPSPLCTFDHRRSHPPECLQMDAVSPHEEKIRGLGDGASR